MTVEIERDKSASARGLRSHAPAAVAYAAMTLAMLSPLLPIFSRGTLGPEYDNLFFVRQVWWISHAVFRLHTSPFFDPTSYYPLGYALGRGAYAPVMTFPALPLTLLAGPIISHNILILLSFLLSALGTYAWVGRLTRDRWAGFVAGTILAMLPYRFAHVIHLNLVTTCWMPWALWAFELYLDEPKRRWAAAVGLGCGLIALSDWYYAYSAALLLPLYFWLRLRQKPDLSLKRLASHAALAGVIALTMIAPFLYDSLRLWRAGVVGGHWLSPAFWNLNPYDFFVPNLQHPLWERLARESSWLRMQYGFWTERGIALGYTAVLLAVVALFKRRRARGVLAVLAVWLLSYLIALGPWLHFHDRPVLVAVPRALAQAAQHLAARFEALRGDSAHWAEQSKLPVPLASLWLYLFVPITRGMRVMARFGIWTGLMTSALAGWGATVLFERFSRRTGQVPPKLVVTAALVALVLFESWTPLPTIVLEPRAIDRWLSQQPADTVVVEFPVKQNLRPLQDYYKTVHQRRTVFGPIGDSYPDPEARRRADAISDFPSQQSLGALRGWHTTHVLVTASEVSDWPALERSLSKTPALRRIQSLAGVHAYALDRPTP